MKQGTQPGTQLRFDCAAKFASGLYGHVTLTTVLGVVF